MVLIEHVIHFNYEARKEKDVNKLPYIHKIYISQNKIWVFSEVLKDI